MGNKGLDTSMFVYRRCNMGICRRAVLAAFVLLIPLNWQATYSQDVPRVILSTLGPGEQVRDLAFSNDSQRLYAAGLDKVIHTWDIGWDVDRLNAGEGSATYVGTLRWEIGRGPRGRISVISICPTRDELAAAGCSAREETGDLAVFDLGLDQVSASIPTPLERKTDKLKAGHRSEVLALDYSPDGNKLCSSAETGQVFVWNRDNQGKWLGKEIFPSSGSSFLYPKPVLWISNSKLVFAVNTNAGSEKLQMLTPSSGATTQFPEEYVGRVSALARDDKGLWASADTDGHIYVTSPDNQRWTLRTSLPVITDLAFGPNGILAVAVSGAEGNVQAESAIELWNSIEKKRIDRLVVSKTEKVAAVTISPNGQFLAFENVEDFSVNVIHLVNNDGALLPNPLSEKPLAQLRGLGKRIRTVAIAADSSSVGFSLETEDVANANILTSQINLKNASIEPANPKIDWVFGSQTMGEWELRVDPNDRTEWSILRSGRLLETISLDRELQGSGLAACWIADPSSPGQPAAFAIGTEQVQGVFVYSLPAPGQSSRLLRWFRDHNGPIASLVSSLDGRLLVSGSWDQTVKIWSLKDLTKRTPDFENSQAWGARFEIRNGNVIAADVADDGIAYGRGLRNGSIITRIQGYLPDSKNTLVDATAGNDSAQKILENLRRVSLLRESLIYARTGQEELRFVIRPAWEPLVTAFLNVQGDWAIWHPSGYYNASVAEGGEVFGWQINQGPDKPPSTYKADFFQKQFERPDILSELFLTLSIEQALTVGKVDTESSINKSSVDIPRVKITSPTATDQPLAGGKINITAQVNFPNDVKEPFDVIASIDGVRLGKADSEIQGASGWVYSWETVPRGLLNQIEVVVTERNGALASYYASDVVYRRAAQRSEVPFKLSILSLASEKYLGPGSSNRGGFGELQFPLDDVDAVLDSLKGKELTGLGFFKIGSTKTLRNSEISRASVQAEIAAINKTIGKNSVQDILLVYLAGHGKTVEGEYYYIPTSVESADDKEIMEKGIPWRVLAAAGADNCKVIYMIDTCHSGSTVDAKSSIRDARRSQGIVLAAATSKADAIEIASLGHGCFTYSVLLGLDGRADGAASDSDKIVDLPDLVQFVKTYVASLTGGEQEPSMSPTRLLETLQLPLVSVKAD